ncbi:hypothetical protein V1517DRAFT_316620 [Lipomyces orientalis]|uniref:Uncharacterized protein n=1 Tax=Lipomyces orientalis TaxID=1233043 RepID=A0ACC3TUI3_9ASCO
MESSPITNRYEARSDQSVSSSAVTVPEGDAEQATLADQRVDRGRFMRVDSDSEREVETARTIDEEDGSLSVVDPPGRTISESQFDEELQPSQIDPALKPGGPRAERLFGALPSLPGLSFAPLDVQRRQFQQFQLQKSPQPFFWAQSSPFAWTPSYRPFPQPAPYPYPYTIPPLPPDHNPADPFVGMILNDIEHIHNVFTEYAKRVGFAITKAKSSSARTYQLMCKCHGTPRNTRHLPTIKGEELNGKVRRRDLHSRKTGCEWRARFKMQFNDQWVLTYVGEHNHELEPDMAIRYAENRQTTQQGIELMKALKKTSATYKEIAEVVNATTGSNLLARDVYNRTKEVPRARPLKRGRPSTK